MEEERRRLDEEGLRELLKMAEAAAERSEEERAREERRRRDREGLAELIMMAKAARRSLL
jgi:BRCT domain type II-containing protein